MTCRNYLILLKEVFIQVTLIISNNLFKSLIYMKPQLSRMFAYFNVADDLLPQSEVEAGIREGVSFRGSQLLILIFAIFVASLGLNTNSVAVIIGAMLISPLMGPIMGMGLALGIEDYALLRRGLKNIAMAILGSLVASAIFFLISPLYEGNTQLLARTSPSIYDVFIALFGGAAGILSTACRNKGQVLPGVAIATSLMPPLCTAGYGLATLQARFFFGAFYLFFTNMIFILFATWIGVKLMRYHKIEVTDTARHKRVQTLVWTVVCATIGVSIWLTFRMIRTNIFLAAASRFVDTEMVFPNTQVLNHKEYIKNGKRYIDVTLIGEALPKDSLQLAMVNKLDSVGLGGTVINIRQGFSMSAVEMRNTPDADRFYTLMQNEIAQRQIEIDSLKGIITRRLILSDEENHIATEVRTVFPTITGLSLTSAVATTTTDTLRRDTLNLAFVNATGGLSATDRSRLTRYLEARTGKADIHVTVNPQGFPWPHK